MKSQLPLQANENKQTILVDANIISHIASIPNAIDDPNIRSFQEITHKWWKTIKRSNIFISDTIWNEISYGGKEDAIRCQKIVQGITKLRNSSEVHDFSNDLIEEGLLRKKSRNDALILATACIYRIDYLITWNMKDLANNKNKADIAIMAEQYGYALPILCTPLLFLDEYSEIYKYKIEDSGIEEEKVENLLYNNYAMKNITDRFTQADIDANPIIQRCREVRRILSEEYYEELKKYNNDEGKYYVARMDKYKKQGVEFTDVQDTILWTEELKTQFAKKASIKK